MPENHENKPDTEGIEQDDPRLPNKSLFRIDEVAKYFDVTERTIYLWIQHGHLKKEKVVGTVRISRESILSCRFNTSTSD